MRAHIRGKHLLDVDPLAEARQALESEMFQLRGQGGLQIPVATRHKGKRHGRLVGLDLDERRLRKERAHQLVALGESDTLIDSVLGNACEFGTESRQPGMGRGLDIVMELAFDLERARVQQDDGEFDDFLRRDTALVIARRFEIQNGEIIKRALLDGNVEAWVFALCCCGCCWILFGLCW